MFESFNSFSGFCYIFVITTLFVIFYQCIFRFWCFFSDRNIKFVRGCPLLGSNYKSILGIEPAAISYRRLYEHFPTEKFIGFYRFCGRPSFLIRDPDLVKQLLITDCNHFTSKKSSCTPTLFGGQETKLSDNDFFTHPIFYGKRLRNFHMFIVKKSEQFVETLKQTDKIAKLFDGRDLFSRYTNDVLASAAFGIEINSLKDINNKFFKASSSLNETQYMNDLKLLANLHFPTQNCNHMNSTNGNKNIDYLWKTLMDLVKKRLIHGKNENNMIDLLMKVRNGELQRNEKDDVNVSFATTQVTAFNNSEVKMANYSDDDIVEQCMTFFLNCLNSITSIACFLFHELAVNPDIQNKLFSEIETIKNELNGSSFTYDMIPTMKYLDMVVCETLRRWCPVPFFERTCSSPYVIENSNSINVELQIGDSIFVPTYALHLDQTYFSKPLTFNPERFNDENRTSIRAGTYLPFGSEHYCIGSHFTLMTIKTLIFHLLSEFYIDKCYKTQDPLKLKALPLHMDAENGFYIELRRRQPDRSPYKSQVFS